MEINIVDRSMIPPRFEQWQVVVVVVVGLSRWRGVTDEEFKMRSSYYLDNKLDE